MQQQPLMTSDELRTFWKGVSDTVTEARQATRISPPTDQLVAAAPHRSAEKSNRGGVTVAALLLLGCCYFYDIAQPAARPVVRVPTHASHIVHHTPARTPVTG